MFWRARGCSHISTALINLSCDGQESRSHAEFCLLGKDLECKEKPQPCTKTQQTLPLCETQAGGEVCWPWRSLCCLCPKSTQTWSTRSTLRGVTGCCECHVGCDQASPQQHRSISSLQTKVQFDMSQGTPTFTDVPQVMGLCALVN